MNNNRWCYIDADQHPGAERVSQSVLRIKAAINSFLIQCNLYGVRLPRMYVQKLLTLHWHTDSRCWRKNVAIGVTHNEGYIFLCEWLPCFGDVITQDTSQIVIVLSWSSISRCVKEDIANCFGFKGGHKSLHDWLETIPNVIAQDKWPYSFNIPLTVSVMMR